MATNTFIFVGKYTYFCMNIPAINVKMKDPASPIHVYFMPGMAAKPTIFEFIKLPEAQFEMHWLSWIPPLKKESIEAYSKRICHNVKHENVVLVGVSLGGVVVQEMQKFISVRQIVLISSVKTKYEIPGYMHFGRKTGFYKLLPLGLAKYFGKLEKWPLGKFVKSRLHIYNRYLGVTNTMHLKWAAREMVYWNREKPLPHILHIHGNNDHIFPINKIKGCFVVQGGTHLMIINRPRWFNQHLPSLIRFGKLSALN